MSNKILCHSKNGIPLWSPTNYSCRAQRYSINSDCERKKNLNIEFKQWPEIFNNDSTLTSAILDRVLHHANTICIEGKSYRMKDHVET